MRVKIIIFLLWPSLVLSQAPALSSKNKKAIALYVEADNYRVRGQFKEAIELLNMSIEKDPKFSEAYLRLSTVYKAMRQFPKGSAILEKGLNVSTEQKKKPFYAELGESYLQQGIYDKALSNLNLYLNLEKLNKAKIDQVVFLRTNAEFAIKNMKTYSGFKPRKLSDTVNCFTMQYFPVLTADEQQLFFTRRKGVTNDDDEDLVVSFRDKSGKWLSPVSISPNINSINNEGTCTISADGRQIIFTACRGRTSFGLCDLFISTKTGDEWTEPVNLGAQINSSAWESQPSLSADGRILYFVSDRRGGIGGKDLYVSRKGENGQWSHAENLGSKINSRNDEISPFIHVNGRTLFFASNGRPGFGGYDIYRSEKEGPGWFDPVNFGSPVNTFEDQFSLFITADGKRAYYSHERELNDNTGRIYEISVPEDLWIQYRSNFVKGTVRDGETHEPLKAKLELYDLKKNGIVSSIDSDSVTGQYLMVLTQGSEYGLYVRKHGYLFKSLNFNYQEQKDVDGVVVDVDLNKAKTGAAVVLNNIFFEYNQSEIKAESYSELGEVIRFLTENSLIKVEISGHTDNIGAAAYNLQLSQKRAMAVASYLTSHGVDPKRVLQKGYGADKPIQPNDTEDGRRANRRIEFRII